MMRELWRGNPDFPFFGLPGSFRGQRSLLPPPTKDVDRSMRVRTRSATISSLSLAMFRNERQDSNKPLLTGLHDSESVPRRTNTPDFVDTSNQILSKRPRTASDTEASHAFVLFQQGRTTGMRPVGQDLTAPNAGTAVACEEDLRVRIRELEAQLALAKEQAVWHTAKRATMEAKLAASDSRATVAEAKVEAMSMLIAKFGREEGCTLDVQRQPTPPGASPSLEEATATVYGLYNQEDSLCTGNGFFSLNLRPGAVMTINNLLGLAPGDRLLWVGCGNAPEVLSLAMSHPSVAFVAIDKNELAICVAEKKRRRLGLENITLRIADAMLEDHDDYTHVYSAAIAGPELYAKLQRLAGNGKLCVLRSMWTGDTGTDLRVQSVCLSGSGEQRQLLACNLHSNTSSHGSAK